MKTFLHYLSYPLSVVYYLLFGSLLVIMHPIQWFCLKLFGYQAHKKSVDYLNFLLMCCLRVLGTRFRFPVPEDIPKNVPLIIVTNHQSMYDIPPIIWKLRKFHPKFVSKKELGKGIPSVSFNLRNGGSVLIDRKNPEEAVLKMTAFARYLEKNKRSAVIFPEGTRSRTGVPKTFHRKGLQTLINNMPSSYVLPITINNSWQLQHYGMFPIPLGVFLRFNIHPVFKVSDFSTEMLIDIIETQIKKDVKL